MAGHFRAGAPLGGTGAKWMSKSKSAPQITLEGNRTRKKSAKVIDLIWPQFRALSNMLTAGAIAPAVEQIASPVTGICPAVEAIYFMWIMFPSSYWLGWNYWVGKCDSFPMLAVPTPICPDPVKIYLIRPLAYSESPFQTLRWGHTLQKVSPTSKTRRILLFCASLSFLKQTCLHKSCSDFFIFQEMCKFPPISDTAWGAFAPNMPCKE